MFSIKVAILGCARNCAGYLSRSLRNVSAVAQMFTDYRVILYENDSADGTQSMLRAYCGKDPERRHLMSMRFLSAKIPGRTRRLAYIRHQLQRKLAQTAFRPDVVVVMDLDDAGSGPTPRLLEFIREAARFERWDAAFPRLSYDLAAWAPWPPGTSRTAAREAASRRGSFGTRVCSAFNGIGVYKAGWYFRGSYLVPGQPASGRIARPGPCEHITFHASLGPSARFAILNGHSWPG